MPLISVIVPNYNHAIYLPQRMESIFNQTFKDFEIILLDDHSTDNSLQILNKYSDNEKVSHFVLNEINSGSPFKQWEKGIEIASGSYIWIAESDDWCEPNFLEEMVNGIKRDENCVIAFAQSSAIDSSNKILWRSSISKPINYVDGSDFIQQNMLNGNAIFNASMAIFKKEAYHGISRTFSSFKFCGDWLFWIEVARTGNIFISEKNLNYFRKHSQDVSGKAYSSGYNFIEEIRLISILKKSGIISQRVFDQSLLIKHGRFLDHKVKGIIQVDDLKVSQLFWRYASFRAKLKIIYGLLKLKIKKSLYQ